MQNVNRFLRGWAGEQLPPFAAHVMGALGKVLRAHSDAVVYRDTWGDALYAVLTGAAEAAACALDLQKAPAAIDGKGLAES